MDVGVLGAAKQCILCGKCIAIIQVATAGVANVQLHANSLKCGGDGKTCDCL